MYFLVQKHVFALRSLPFNVYKMIMALVMFDQDVTVAKCSIEYLIKSQMI